MAEFAGMMYKNINLLLRKKLTGKHEVIKREFIFYSFGGDSLVLLSPRNQAAT
jgi:hypothetical protein